MTDIPTAAASPPHQEDMPLSELGRNINFNSSGTAVPDLLATVAVSACHPHADMPTDIPTAATSPPHQEDMPLLELGQNININSSGTAMPDLLATVAVSAHHPHADMPTDIPSATTSPPHQEDMPLSELGQNININSSGTAMPDLFATVAVCARHPHADMPRLEDSDNNNIIIPKEIGTGTNDSSKPNPFSNYCDPDIPFLGGQELFVKNLGAVIRPYGIERIILGKNSHKNNKDDKTNTLFPYARCVLICGSCKVAERKKSIEEAGCCGFEVRLKFRDSNYGNTGEAHLQVYKFQLPSTSKHLLVSHETWSEAASKIITNKDMLSPSKTKFIEMCGKNRLNIGAVRSMLSDHFNGVQVSDELVYRVMREGRISEWGDSHDESMVIFYAMGLELQKHEEKFGIGGKFLARTCQSGSLLSWLEQTPLEVLNARVYGKDAVWVDTTHNATKTNLKTGPLSVVDWGGLVAPAGIYQVTMEEINSCLDMQSCGQTCIRITSQSKGTVSANEVQGVVHSYVC